MLENPDKTSHAAGMPLPYPKLPDPPVNQAPPAQSSLHAFMEQAEGPDLSKEVQRITHNPGFLSPDQVDALSLALASVNAPLGEVYGAGFSLSDEVTEQLIMVRAMRRAVITREGQLVEGVAARELKDVVSASTTLLNTLSKSHEKILNFKRQQAMEEAAIDAVRGLGEAEQQKFFSALEERLETIG